MVDAGFGKTIDRNSDALRWASATLDVVASSKDWVATPIAGQRAVRMSTGQGEAAQITMPAGLAAKTAAVDLQLPFTGSQTYQGKLICRELEWYDISADPAGESRFVVLDGPNYAAVPASPPDLVDEIGLVRKPGVKYQMPLWYAVVSQGSATVRLFDLRRWLDQDTAGLAVYDTGWISSGLIFGNGFEPFTDAGWSAPAYRVRGGRVEIVGAAKNTRSPAQWSNGEPMFQLPSFVRPSRQVKGESCMVSTDGNVRAGAYEGSPALSFYASYFLG